MKYKLVGHITISIKSDIEGSSMIGSQEVYIKSKEIDINLHGFSWDGCSPKFKLLGKYFGTWDGKVEGKFYNELNPIPEDKPETYYASLVHDFIYQSKGTFTRKEADALFRELLKQQRFKYTNLYYFFVRMFGWIWWIT